MVLLSQVECLGRAPVINKDTRLKEKFVENLRDPTLRHDIKHWAKGPLRCHFPRYMEE